MDENLTVIKWNVDQADDAYYEVHLYKYWRQQQKRKLSTLKVVGRGNEIEKRTLTNEEIESLFFALEQVNLKYDDGNEVIVKMPSTDYRLRIKNQYFNLDFKWSSYGIFGNNALQISLDYVIEKLCDLRELDCEELGLEIKM